MIKIDKIGKSGLSSSKINNIITDSFDKFNIPVNNRLIEIIFVTPQKIFDLNSKYRNNKNETDVLSFPQASKISGPKIFGSIVICPNVAKKRGENIDQLIKHGLLHLLGFDHQKDYLKWKEAADIINHQI